MDVHTVMAVASITMSLAAIAVVLWNLTGPHPARPTAGEECGGCSGLGSHRRHCRANPDYTREREWADKAENLGDMIGPNNMAAANACYRAAGLLRVEAPDA